LVSKGIFEQVSIIQRWTGSLVIGFFVSLVVNAAVIFFFANGKHEQFIRAFFSVSSLVFHPGFEGGLILFAGNVLLLSIPLTLVAAGFLKGYNLRKSQGPTVDTNLHDR
jgi:hypothetical protein